MEKKQLEKPKTKTYGQFGTIKNIYLPLGCTCMAQKGKRGGEGVQKNHQNHLQSPVAAG